MNRYLRLLSLVLSLLLLFPWTLDAAATELITDGPIDAEDNAILIGQLESMAVDYVTKYVNTAYLYETEDFTTNTLLAVSDEDLSRVGITQLTTDGTAASTADLKANLQQFADVAGYFKHIRSTQNYILEDFSMTFLNVSASIGDGTAEVSLYTLITFRYPDCESPSACGDNYTVFFRKIGEMWCIVDIYSEEIAAYRLTYDQFDCAEAITQFNGEYLKNEGNEAEQFSSEPSTSTETDSPSSPLRGNHRRIYQPSNAIAYAYTYTTATYNNIAAGNDPNFINDLFPPYSQNCINFASQCVWAGLNGNNYETATSKPIAWKNLPMDYDSSASSDSATEFWYKGSTSWISCSNFLRYIQSSMTETSDTALKANLYEAAPYNGFNGISTSQLNGSVLILAQPLSNEEYDPYHALFVTNATGTQRGQVFVCANSPMRQNVAVSYTAYGYDKIYAICPQYLQIKVDSRCANGHTYPASVEDPTKTVTKCSVCSYYDLRLIATMLKPVAAGTTKTLQASANYTCYRMAINIKHEDGTNIWYEAYNADTISYSYTFNEPGLYTIYVYARDLNPDVEPTTFGTSHVFTVRVS